MMRSIYYRYQPTGPSDSEWRLHGYAYTQNSAERDANILLEELLTKGHDHAEVSITNRGTPPATDMP